MKWLFWITIVTAIIYLSYTIFVHNRLLGDSQHYQKELHFAANIAPVYCLLTDSKQHIDSLKVTFDALQCVADSIQCILDYIEHLDPLCRQLNRASPLLDSLLPSLTNTKQTIKSAEPYDSASQRLQGNLETLFEQATLLAEQIKSGSDYCRSGNLIRLTTKCNVSKSVSVKLKGPHF
jgi:hypothetical protein